MTEEYNQWIADIKNRIKQSQIKASVKVNYELLDLYWNLGHELVEKQKNAKRKKLTSCKPIFSGKANGKKYSMGS